MRVANFMRDYGVELTSGPLAGLTARAVVVLDRDTRAAFAIVDEIKTTDYAARWPRCSKLTSRASGDPDRASDRAAAKGGRKSIASSATVARPPPATKGPTTRERVPSQPAARSRSASRRR